MLAGLNPVDLYLAAGMYGELSVPCVVGLEWFIGTALLTAMVWILAYWAGAGTCGP